MAAAPSWLLGPRFRGGNEGERRAHSNSMRRSLSSFSRRTPGSRDHRALDGDQKDIKPPQPPRHGGCWFSKEPEHRVVGKPAALRSAPWQRRHRGSWAPAFLPPRFPGERRDPGATELWMAAKRTLTHHGLRSTEGAGFSRAPGHPAGGKPTALRSAPWQRLHRGSWAPAFAGETKGARTCALRRWNPRCAEVCAVIAAPPGFLGPRFPTLFVFPANAGTQGPPSTGWQPKGHRTTKGSAAGSPFKGARAEGARVVCRARRGPGGCGCPAVRQFRSGRGRCAGRHRRPGGIRGVPAAGRSGCGGRWWAAASPAVG